MVSRGRFRLGGGGERGERGVANEPRQKSFWPAHWQTNKMGCKKEDPLPKQAKGRWNEHFLQGVAPLIGEGGGGGWDAANV